MNAVLDMLNRGASDWGSYVLHVTWQSSLVAIVMLVVVRLGRNWNSHLRYALLLLALAKFTIPPFAAAPFGMFSQIRPTTSVGADRGSFEHRPNVDRGVQRHPESGYRGLGFDDTPETSVHRSSAPDKATAVQLANYAENGVAQRTSSVLMWVRGGQFAAWLLLIHAAGGMAFVSWAVWEYRKVRRLCASGSDIESGELRGIAQSVSRRLRLRRRVRLLLCGEPVSPMAFGIFRPVVLLPRELMERLSLQEQRGIMAHELVHHRRWDHLVLCLQAVLVCFWWFNPLVWLLNRATIRCREECCDDRVLDSGLASQEVYGHALLRIAEYMSRQERGRAMIRFAGRMHPLTSRIARVLSAGRNHSGQLSVPAVITVILLACLLLPGTSRGWSADGAVSEDKRHETTTGSGVRRLDLYGDPLPDGAIARLGTIRFRQSYPTSGGGFAAFVGGGRQFITTDADSIRVWDRDTGRIMGQFRTVGRPIRHAAVSKDGLRIATLSQWIDPDEGFGDTWLQLWSWHPDHRTITATWKRVMVNFNADCVTVSPDRTSVVVAGWDRDAKRRQPGLTSIRFFDAESGDETETHSVSIARISGLAVAPTGQTIAIGSHRGAWLWDWRAQAGPVPLEEARNQFTRAVELSPDGELLATLGNYSNGVRLWSVKSKQLIRRFDTGEERYGGQDLKFTSDGRYLIVLSRERGVEFWDVRTGTVAQRLTGACRTAQTLSLSENDEWLAVASDQVIQVWDPVTETHLGQPYVGHEASVENELRFWDDGRSIVTASHDGSARIWDTDSGGQTQIVRHEGTVRSVVISPDHQLMATSSMDDVVALWNVNSGRRILAVPGHGRLGGRRDLHFSADGGHLLSWGDDLDLRVFDAHTGDLVVEYPTHPSDVELVVTEHGWYRPKDQTEMLVYHTQPKSGEFTADGRQLVMSYYGTLYFYDVASGEEIRKFKPDAYLDTVVFPTDASVLVTREIMLRDGYSENTAPWRDEAWRTLVRIRDYATLNILRQIELPGQSRGAMAIAPNGKLLALSVLPKYRHSEPEHGPWIGIFETDTARECARVRGFNAYATCVAFNHNGRRLASSHADTTILLWDVEYFRTGTNSRGTGS